MPPHFVFQEFTKERNCLANCGSQPQPVNKKKEVGIILHNDTLN